MADAFSADKPSLNEFVAAKQQNLIYEPVIYNHNDNISDTIWL